MTRNSNRGVLSRTRQLLVAALILTLTGCGGAYVAAAIIATQDDSSTTIDTTQPDLIVTNVTAPSVGTIVAVNSATEAGTTVEFFTPISYRVLNAGNDVAPAGYGVSLFLSRTKNIDATAVRIRDTIVNVTTQVGEFTRVSTNNAENVLSVNLDGEKTDITEGSYFLLARAGAVAATTELDTSNNDALAIGQLRIFDPRASANDAFPDQVPSNPNTANSTPGSPNFVLERMFVPSFAFARDSVNASQQPVTGQRVMNVSLQVALRGAATNLEERFELELFLSNDQEISGDDLSLPSTTGNPLSFTFPASAVNTSRQFSNFSVLLPAIDDFEVALPQTFFVIGRLLPLGPSGTGNSQEMTRDNYDNERPAETRTRVYGRFTQSDKAILPDLTVDSPTRTDPDALEFTTTAFSIPTPGSQRIFSFEIPDVANISPDQSQVLVLLQSTDFDPVVELLGPNGGTIRFQDDSELGQASFLTAPLSSTGSGNNVFYVAISSRSGTGSGDFNLTIFLQSRTDSNRPVILPVNLGNMLSLDRARATLTSANNFPVSLPENSGFNILVDGTTNIPVVFQSNSTIADLTQATAAEVANTIQVQANQVGDLLDVRVDAQGRIQLISKTVGANSSIRVDDGVEGAAVLIGFPEGEEGVSEQTVIFDFNMNQPDIQFLFYVPSRGAFEISTQPSLDLFGGVNASLQFFSGVTQRNISLLKSSSGSTSTVFRSETGGDLALGQGFYSLILRAPQAIPNVDYRLQFKFRFDRTVEPQ